MANIYNNIPDMVKNEFEKPEQPDYQGVVSSLNKEHNLSDDKGFKLAKTDDPAYKGVNILHPTGRGMTPNELEWAMKNKSLKGYQENANAREEAMRKSLGETDKPQENNALKFLQGSVSPEEYEAITSNKNWLDGYLSGKYNIGELKNAVKADEFDKDANYPEDEFTKSQKMSKEDFIDDLVNNKGWDKEEAKRHADMQFSGNDVEDDFGFDEEDVKEENSEPEISAKNALSTAKRELAKYAYEPGAYGRLSGLVDTMGEKYHLRDDEKEWLKNNLINHIKNNKDSYESDWIDVEDGSKGTIEKEQYKPQPQNELMSEEDNIISTWIDDYSWSITPRDTVDSYSKLISSKAGVSQGKVLAVMERELGKKLSLNDNMAKVMGMLDED